MHGDDHDDHEDQDRVDDGGGYDKEICVENHFDFVSWNFHNPRIIALASTILR